MSDLDAPPWDVDEAPAGEPVERDPDTSDMFGAPAGPAPAAPVAEGPAPAYQVLARKYRPRRFEDLIGQQAMVRTLTNAFATGRIAHAFMLTGVRGVGKTTTARLLARALNYESDTVHAPSVDLNVEGAHCRGILEGRHLDVLELDAASRTKVDEMRELLDSVRYAPVEARYKVYIIDEVHMLSTAAFNALLKTLEEPPPHAKFIFATTEIRKVPVTILSRCQRFDLRRVEPDVLGPHLARIAEREGAQVEPDGLALIARAAEGSVRDGLSLLDQAIVLGEGGRAVPAEAVRDMLGLADRGQTLSLLEAVLAGRTADALSGFRTLYGYGADPAQVVGDLLEHAHGAAVAKAIGADVLGLPKEQAARLGEAGGRVSAGTLSRLWQMLLKAHDEVRRAPDPAAAVEMALIRLAYAADLPAPEEALRALREGRIPAGGDGSAASPAGGGSGGPNSGGPSSVGPSGGARMAAGGGGSAQAYGAAATVREPAPADAPRALAQPQTTAELMALIEARGDLALKFDVHKFVRPLSVNPGAFAFAPAPKAPANLGPRLAARLKEWTGRTWLVDVAPPPATPVGLMGDAPGASDPPAPTPETASERGRRLDRERHEAAAADPFVQALLAAFPGAQVVAVRDRTPEPPSAAAPAPTAFQQDQDDRDDAGQDIGEWAPYEVDDLDHVDREGEP